MDTYGLPLTTEARAIFATGLNLMLKEDCTDELREKIEALLQLLVSSRPIVIITDRLQ